MGDIPAELGDLTALDVLYLSGNQLTGSALWCWVALSICGSLISHGPAGGGGSRPSWAISPRSMYYVSPGTC